MADPDTLRELAGRLKQGAGYLSVDTINEASDAIIELLDENERLRKELKECAAEWRSPPTTMGGAFEYVSAEFKRRMQIAADALAHP